MSVKLDHYRLPEATPAETEDITQRTLETYGIDINNCSPEVQQIIIDFYQAGASTAIMGLLSREQQRQQTIVEEA